MAKAVIYLFTYFCNAECSKIIYGYGINTETVGRHAPFLLLHHVLFQQGGKESAHVIRGLTHLPLKAIDSRGVSNIKPETPSRTPRLSAKLPVKKANPSIYLMCG